MYRLLISQFINSPAPICGPMQKSLRFSDQVLTASYAIGCAFLAIGAVVLDPFAGNIVCGLHYTFSSRM
ncbi:hypothetical protein BKA59DRAFT_478172 [Fusarium tricinctum]|uniref:Uncharacterized protein n=1 Tax=Fusarium tricinctum TaxID=61284 RepID=A0A8K0RXG6_9HYPO|nr:hypothetical protein BKA59DRAFT_478172 [Fusarium tricinctum]